MSEAINRLEDEIRTSLLSEEKEEIISKGFKISIKDDGQIEITELPLPYLEQLELPLNTQSEKSKKGGTP
jgi:hypothetical protein